MQLMLSADTMLCYGAIVNRQMDVPANPRSRRDTDSDNTVYKEVHFSKGFQQKQDLCELKG